jgi:DNA-directed RNA polymerase specialized sigma subunit
MTDYTVKITIKNGRILRLMRKAGIATVAELSRKCGVTQSQIGDIINLKKAPVNSRGQWAGGVENIAGVLCCDPEDMFTESQLTLAIKSNSRTIEMDEPQVMALASGDAESQSWARIETQRLLGGLNERSRQIIEARAEGETAGEIAEQLNLSVARIHQIEATALRKMRRHAQVDESNFHMKMAPETIDYVPNTNWKSRDQKNQEAEAKKQKEQKEWEETCRARRVNWGQRPSDWYDL